MHDSRGFDSRVAIVTGGGVSPGRVASIGEATCRLLGARGARVAVVDIEEAAALATVERITDAGGQAMAFDADLSIERECHRAVAECVAYWTVPSVLVNNVAVASGTVSARPTRPTSTRRWRSISRARCGWPSTPSRR